jgi:bifunctional isochorismate lyase/aryl carrier protein
MSIGRIAPYALPESRDLPPARAAWSLVPRRAALLVHDMQEYFLLPFAEGQPLEQVLPNVRALRAAARRADVPVFFSAQPPEQDRAERGLLWDLWGAGIVNRPEQSRLAAGLELESNEVLVPKRRYSAFYDTALGQELSRRGRDQLMVCGVYAHIGVLATALDAFMRGVKPFVVADATADFSLEDHTTALRQVARTCGVVATTASLIDVLDRTEAP